MSRNKREGHYWGVTGDHWCDLYGHYWRTNKRHSRCPKHNSLKYYRRTPSPTTKEST